MQDAVDARADMQRQLSIAVSDKARLHRALEAEKQSAAALLQAMRIEQDGSSALLKRLAVRLTTTRMLMICCTCPSSVQMESEELQAARTQHRTIAEHATGHDGTDTVAAHHTETARAGVPHQDQGTVHVSSHTADGRHPPAANDNASLLRLQQENALLQQQLAEAHVRISEVAAEALAASTPLKLIPGAAGGTCTTCKGALGDQGAPCCAACGAPHEPVCERCGLSANLPTELNKARLLLSATRAALESVARLKTEVGGVLS